MDLTGQLWQWVVEKFITTLIVVPTLGYIAWFVLRNVIRLSLQIWHLFHSRQRALEAVRRDGLCEGKGVWITSPIEPPHDYWRSVTNSKILAIANLKGGVGKTTLAANLGAYFAKDWQKRVLLIDLDFQGSLSSMAFPGKDWLPAWNQSSLATRLISGDIPPADVRLVAQTVNLNTFDNSRGRLQVVTAYYDLAQADNRIMVEWLLRYSSSMPADLFRAILDLLAGRLQQTPDVRYTLASVLHSQAVQQAFDLIIIDCPPRLTTSKIQAFCASSHLLIPTIFDRTSAEAVVSLRDQVETLRSAQICPHLKYIGVVGTMWEYKRVAQEEARNTIKDALGKNSIEILPETTFIPQAAALVNNASEGIAHIAMPNGKGCDEIREAIARLSEHIAAKMGVPLDTYFREAAE